MAFPTPALPLGAAERYPGLYSLLEAISGVLNELVYIGEQKPLTFNPQTAKFYGSQACPYPINSYLRRICQYSGVSNECFILMMAYIDRIVCRGVINLTRTNVHRLVITAIMLAAKFFDDQFYFNPFFATVGGIKAHEINALEVELLFLLEFDLFVSVEEYTRYYNTLSEMIYTRGITLNPEMMPHQLILPPPEVLEAMSEEEGEEEEAADVCVSRLSSLGILSQ